MPLRHAPRALFWLHVLAGLVTITVLLLSSPWNIGEGRFSEFIRAFEQIDFRWWVLVPVVIVWAVPIAIVLLARQAREAGLQIEQLRELVRKTLEGRQIPIAVDVDARIPVRITQPLRVPVELDTKVPIDEEIEVEAEVPVSVVLPIDTEVETDLLRFGTIKVPIRAEIPIDIVLPVKGVIRARSSGLTVKLREEATVHMPAFEVPVQSRIETRVDLLGSLRAAEEHVRRRLGSGSGSGSE